MIGVVVSYILNLCKTRKAHIWLGVVILSLLSFWLGYELNERRVANIESLAGNIKSAADSRDAKWELKLVEVEKRLHEKEEECQKFQKINDEIIRNSQGNLGDRQKVIEELQTKLDNAHGKNAELARDLELAKSEILNYEILRSLYESLPPSITNLDAITLVCDYVQKNQVLNDALSAKFDKSDKLTEQFFNLASIAVQYRVQELSARRMSASESTANCMKLFGDMIVLYVTIGKIKEHFAKHIIISLHKSFDKNLTEDSSHYKNIVNMQFPCEKNFELLFTRAMAVDITRPECLKDMTDILNDHLSKCISL